MNHPTTDQPRRFLALGLLLILPVPIAGALATYEAARLGQHPALGSPLLALAAPIGLALAGAAIVGAWLTRGQPALAVCLGLLGAIGGLSTMVPIHSPLALLRWLDAFRGTPFLRSLGLHAAASLLVFAAVVAAVLRQPDRSKQIHGSSRFARLRELRAAGLLDREGLILGRVGRKIVRTSHGGHVLAVMPTGDGKTSCLLIPSILTMGDAMVIADVKGAEIWQATAGACARTHDVYRFEPVAGRIGAQTPTAHWNPLDEVPRGPGDVAALQRQAADMIVPARQGHETHWHRSARELFVLLALHVIYSVKVASSIGALRRLLFSSDQGLGNHKADATKQPSAKVLFVRILDSTHDPEYTYGWRDPVSNRPVTRHPEVTNLATRFAATESRELSSIISTLSTFLQPWADSRVDRATEASDFSLRDLAPGVARGRPCALYVVIPRHDLARLAPLLRLLYTSLASLICADARFVDWNARPHAGRRTWLFLDEFPMLGYMPVFGDMLATLRGYGATLVILAQDLAQIRGIYGAEEPITGGCSMLLTTRSQRPETLRHISQLAGDTTVSWSRTSHSSSGGTFGRASRSRSTAETRRPLMTTGEVRTLGATEALLFAPGLHPARLCKTPYFDDPKLRRLAALPPPITPIPASIASNGGAESQRPIKGAA